MKSVVMLLIVLIVDTTNLKSTSLHECVLKRRKAYKNAHNPTQDTNV